MEWDRGVASSTAKLVKIYPLVKLGKINPEVRLSPGKRERSALLRRGVGHCLLHYKAVSGEWGEFLPLPGWGARIVIPFVLSPREADERIHNSNAQRAADFYELTQLNKLPCEGEDGIS